MGKCKNQLLLLNDGLYQKAENNTQTRITFMKKKLKELRAAGIAGWFREDRVSYTCGNTFTKIQTKFTLYHMAVNVNLIHSYDYRLMLENR